MTVPFDSFQRGMTGGWNMMSGFNENREKRDLSSAYKTGGMTGARDAAYGQGNFQLGGQLDTRVKAEDTASRGRQIAGALKTGSYEDAMGFASSPEEFAQITAVRDNATASERATFRHNAENMVAVLTAVEGLPPEQQFAAIQHYAPQFGIDPGQITPEAVTPQAIRGWRVKAGGLASFMAAEDRAADNARQDRETAARIEAMRSLGIQREASANAANARAAKTRSAPSGGRSGGRQSAPSAAPAARPWERKW